MEYLNNVDIEDYRLIGQISELFSSPVIPKISVVGLSDEEVCGSEELKLFKDILSRALDNLFVIDFIEQFIPPLPKLSSNQGHYRNHEVKESWMWKIRQDRPALLIDFRLISMYSTEFNADEAILIEQISQTKASLPMDGPIYLVWLAGLQISNQKISTILKGTRMDKSTISFIELSADSSKIAVTLKSKIQECFEHGRSFYQNLSKKYKKLLSKSDQVQKFLQPWMSPIYYYFKLAVLEEFRGDFQSSLKYYHTILAKFKELIETTGCIEGKNQRINSLRKFADICFIRLSFLLFRLDQSGEAEFGLFRYLTYFGQGLGQSEQYLWRYNMSRTFARQLSKSTIWNSKNKLLMRGPGHFFIYGLIEVEKYLKYFNSHEENNIYQIQEMIMKDLSEALDSSVNNTKLEYFVDFIQILILKQFIGTFQDDSIEFINYLKTSKKIKGWKFIESFILKKSISLSIREGQNYEQAVIDTWRCNEPIEDFNLFEDWCFMNASVIDAGGNAYSYAGADSSTPTIRNNAHTCPIRLNFNADESKYVFCNVKFLRRRCEIFEPCEIELNILCTKYTFKPESIGIFLNDEESDPITFICTENDHFIPGKVQSFKSEFIPTKIGKVKISFVTMQLERPFLALQFDESCFLHQSEEKVGRENIEFIRICQSTSKTNLKVEVEPLRPKVSFSLQFKESKMILMESDLAVLLNIKNETIHSIMASFQFENKEHDVYLGPKEVKTLGLTYHVPNHPSFISITVMNRI